MNWRSAFLAQARHEYGNYRRLNKEGGNFADQLHYLQMSTEKLARGYLVNPAAVSAPEMTHAGIVRMLQHLKADPAMRRRLGYQSAHVFKAYVDSLLGTAQRVQSLAPAIAGTTQPNAEYPWWESATNTVQTPHQFRFPEFDEFRNARASKFLKLIDQLMLLVSD